MVHYLCYNGMQGVAPNITGVTRPSTQKWNHTAKPSHWKNDVAWPLTRTATNPQFRDNHFLILIYNWIWWCVRSHDRPLQPNWYMVGYKSLVPQLQKDVQAVYKRKHFQQKAQTFKSLISQCEASCCVHKIGSNWNLTNEMIGKITDNDSGL